MRFDHLFGWAVLALAGAAAALLAYEWQSLGRPGAAAMGAAAVLGLAAFLWPVVVERPRPVARTSRDPTCAACHAPWRGYPRAQFCIRCGGTSMQAV